MPSSNGDRASGAPQRGHGRTDADPPASFDDQGRRALEVLEAVGRNGRVTQRGLASDLGIALGLANLYVKRLVHKGYIKCVNVQRNRVLYLITPKGVAEKARLTYEFMEHSLRLYRQAREHLRAAVIPLAAAGHRRIAIFGTGEPAELAYISLKELGLEPVAVFDVEAGSRSFLGLPVQSLDRLSASEYDAVIVARLDDAEGAIDELLALGVPPDCICSLRGEVPVRTDRNGRSRVRRGSRR